MNTNLYSPGPGSYKPIETMSKTGQYFSAKYKGSGAPRIHTSSGTRDRTQFMKIDMSIPGPGKYDIHGITKDGKY